MKVCNQKSQSFSRSSSWPFVLSCTGIAWVHGLSRTVHACLKDKQVVNEEVWLFSRERHMLELILSTSVKHEGDDGK
jgi:hypothetical protein